MSSFSEALRRIRIEKNMTQEEFAHFLGTSKQNISRYESGAVSPKISTAAAIAYRLGVPLDELNGSRETTAHAYMDSHYMRTSGTEHYYDDHAVQSDGAILASPEYQAKKYREEMELKRLERSSGHITQEELELIKLFRSTDAKGQEMIKNIAQMVNERAAAKESDGE